VGNLVDNALKFTPNGGRVTVRGFARAGTIGFEVTDTGPGIPAHEAACVLRRFYRAESSRNTPGSGLGLALVAAVARLHGMTLTISDARPGCRITIARHENAFGSTDLPMPDTALTTRTPYAASNTGSVRSSFTRSNTTTTGRPTLKADASIPRACAFIRTPSGRSTVSRM